MDVLPRYSLSSLIGFKRIFGQEFSKPLLIDFLNNLLIGEEADVNSLTKEERLHYDAALRKYRDTLCVLESAELRGEKQGEERGLEKGRLFIHIGCYQLIGYI